MSDGIKRLFRGSFVQVSYLSKLLQENGIVSLMRNYRQESLVAGWADGLTDDNVDLFVNAEDYDNADLMLKEFLESSESTTSDNELE